MVTILEDFFESKLRCPVCKGGMEHRPDDYLCRECGTRYPKKDGIPDFRVIAPEYARSVAQARWADGQKGFEQFAAEIVRHDSREFYLEEIDSVTEIYLRDFPPFYGTLLDVGGSKGTLRHFLNPNVKYLVVDPQIDAFEGLELQPGLLQTYPFLAEPCNFLAGFAEQLPLSSRQFDFVHMRSVLDHCYNPQLAIKEAFRVLKEDGKLMIGSSIIAKCTLSDSSPSRLTAGWARLVKKIQKDGVSGLLRASLGRLVPLKNHHMIQWRKEDLVDMVERNGFFVEKLVWQKPPYDYCIYMLCGKIIKSGAFRKGTEFYG
jgi:SAM-dependent methyltransferase